ncbi:MAG: hypothetical protein QNK80_05125 [Akkermansiaceae bacterium]
MRFLILLLITCLVSCDSKTPGDPHVDTLAPLIDPAKLDTLKGERAANRRLRKIAYHLETARLTGTPPEDSISPARDSREQSRQGGEGIPNPQHGHPPETRMPPGWQNCELEMRPPSQEGHMRGTSPALITSSQGVSARNWMSDSTTWSSKLNGNKVTQRQVALGRKWNAVGLLSDEGLRAVEAQYR